MKNRSINKKSFRFITVIIFTVITLLVNCRISAQFIDNFDKSMIYESSAVNGWDFFTGDGFAKMQFKQADGTASVYVDATKDKLGIWWALIRRCVSAGFDLSLLAQPNYELRIEARIKTSHAPRRVNLHLNTQRTMDFHSHLMEFDIPDTSNWHTISMTTNNFDIQPGDTVGAQLALMDWGPEKYRVDIDYFKVDIVNIDSVGEDLGNPLLYRPPVPKLNTFKRHVTVVHDAMIDLEYPDENFNNWHVDDEGKKINVLTTNSTQYIILRWDLSEFSGKKVVGLGLLELSTYSVERSEDNRKDFGMIRVTEILGGNPHWLQENVTYNIFLQGKPLTEVINSQMIIDVNAAAGKGSKNLITISQPVLQRLIEGKTFGLAIRPLGPINASFYALENNIDSLKAKLHFNIVSQENSR